MLQGNKNKRQIQCAHGQKQGKVWGILNSCPELYCEKEKFLGRVIPPRWEASAWRALMSGLPGRMACPTQLTVLGDSGVIVQGSHQATHQQCGSCPPLAGISTWLHNHPSVESSSGGISSRKMDNQMNIHCLIRKYQWPGHSTPWNMKCS